MADEVRVGAYARINNIGSFYRVYEGQIVYVLAPGNYIKKVCYVSLAGRGKRVIRVENLSYDVTEDDLTMFLLSQPNI